MLVNVSSVRREYAQTVIRKENAMKDKRKIVAIALAGIFGGACLAYAADNLIANNLTVEGVLDVTGASTTDHYVDGRLNAYKTLTEQLNVTTSDAHFGLLAPSATQGVVTVYGGTSANLGGKLVLRGAYVSSAYKPSWNLLNNDATLSVNIDSGADRDVVIENTRSGYNANLTLDGDFYMQGGMVFDHGATTSDAFVTSNNDGDVVIQLGS